MVSRDEIRRLTMPLAPAWLPWTMAAICFASALVLFYSTIFPERTEIDQGFRLSFAAIVLGAGLAMWVFARHFRIWMVHAVLLLGLGTGLIGLALAANAITMVLALNSVLWICLVIGLAFSPSVTRVYAVLICLGLAAAVSANGLRHGPAIAVLFGVSYVVTMEILARMTTWLRRAAATDPLTGVLNRAGLERELGRVRGFGRDVRVSLLMVDLDELKLVNDLQGHLEGDRQIRELARRWRENLRAGDLVARIGGDEFVVVSPGDDEVAARAMAERLREVSPLSWSGGVVISEPEESLESMIGRADQLLYAEKARKRSRAAASGPEGRDPEAPVGSLESGTPTIGSEKA